MNNEAALGYMTIAAKEIGLDKRVIEAIARMMIMAMDEKTEEEAIKAYKSF